MEVKGKEKERKRIYIAPFIYYVYLKALRHGSHSFTCKCAMPAFPFLLKWIMNIDRCSSTAADVYSGLVLREAHQS